MQQFFEAIETHVITAILVAVFIVIIISLLKEK